MDYNSIAKQLRQYSQDLIAYKMGAEFADACNDAADAIYQLSAELERAMKERCKLQELAHSQRNGLEQLRVELSNYSQVTDWLRRNGFESFEALTEAFEQVKREKDEAVVLLRETNWCAWCVGFNGLKGCADNAMSVCCKDDDHYQFRGLKKEERAMDRLTFEGNFCDIAKCTYNFGGPECRNGPCSQRQVWERLKAIENILGDEYDLGRLHILLQAEKDGRLVVLDEPRKPLVWGDDNHDTILCPNCKHDLMGGFPEADPCETPMYQCPYCGQPIDGTKALNCEEAEAALAQKGGLNE